MTENSQKRPKIAANGLIKVVENGRTYKKMAKSYREQKKEISRKGKNWTQILKWLKSQKSLKLAKTGAKFRFNNQKT